VLNRVDEQLDSNAYYYQRRYYNRDRGFGENKARPLDTQRQEEVAILN
jgi:hypothetical protein